MTLAELSRRERKKEETRRRIFTTAVALFRAKGFEATTVDDIIAGADVGRGTFFNYFPRKESVLAWLSEEKLLVAEAHASSLLDGPGSAREKLIELFTLAGSAYTEDRDLSRWVFGEWMRTAFAPTREVEVRWNRLVTGVIERGRAQGELRDDAPADRIEAVLESVYLATVYHWLYCPEECRAQDFELIPELRARLSLAFAGLEAGAAR
jgi:AcrR family transcriptional regulator